MLWALFIISSNSSNDRSDNHLLQTCDKQEECEASQVSIMFGANKNADLRLMASQLHYPYFARYKCFPYDE